MFLHPRMLSLLLMISSRNAINDDKDDKAVSRNVKKKTKKKTRNIVKNAEHGVISRFVIFYDLPT